MKIFHYALRITHYALILICAAIFFAPSTVNAETNWYWLFADDRYSKYFEPESVKVEKKVVTGDGREIPIEIEAWTKTSYSYEGAAETIKNYGIANILPDPRSLSYSVALLRINPQNRTLQYAREDFYNDKGEVVWSKGEGRVKEINSQSFDEDFYCAIVDAVFDFNETERKIAEDRWIDLYSFTNSNGETVNLTADTTTMRLKGSNLFLWEWETTKNKAGQTLQIRFMKKAVNLTQGTEVIKSGRVWTPTNSWQDLVDENDGAYRMIKSDEPDYKGLVRLRAYVKNNSRWVCRYSLD
ncbi:MAG: hypothetical protein IKE46_03915 [Selenomonadaceae bacterium]|nr:hypothetical protein [Selenomonadaceae bacterium]